MIIKNISEDCSLWWCESNAYPLYSFLCRLSIPYSWVKFTQNNITRSQRERAASERLRGEIDACLRACANAMWSQFNAVNNSFNSRIRETTDARDKLQNHLQRVSYCWVKGKNFNRVLAYLTNFESLRFVGEVRAKNYMRSSYSQWWPTVNQGSHGYKPLSYPTIP